MKDRLGNHIASLQNMDLFYTCRTILDNKEFYTWPASLSYHHAYEGGLLAHTVEVCDIALGMSALTTKPRAKHDVLIAAALLHDFMKTREYVRVTVQSDDTTRMLKICDGDYDGHGYATKTGWVKNETRVKLFGHHEHIIAGALEFTRVAEKYGVSPETIDAVTHCILSHHGRREWGSPVEPQTIEALILHQADMTSAKYGVTKDSL